MLFCFTNISNKILMRVLGYSLTIKTRILAHFCHMLLTLKALVIFFAKAVLLSALKIIMKFQLGNNVIKLFTTVIYDFL
jgi:hypothetical protein